MQRLFARGSKSAKGGPYPITELDRVLQTVVTKKSSVFTYKIGVRYKKVLDT